MAEQPSQSSEVGVLVARLLWAAPVWAAALVAVGAGLIRGDWPQWQRISLWVACAAISIAFGRWQAARCRLAWLRMTLPHDLTRVGIRIGGNPPRIVSVKYVPTGRQIVLSTRRGHSRELVERHRPALAGVLGVERLDITSNARTVTVTTVEHSAREVARSV